MSTEVQHNTNTHSSSNLKTELSQTDAIKVLIRAAQVAQEKGAYTLQEASLIHNAVSTFMVVNEEKNNSELVNNTESVNNINNSE